MGDEFGNGFGRERGIDQEANESLLMLATGTMSRVTAMVLFS